MCGNIIKLVYGCILAVLCCGVATAQQSWLLQQTNGSWRKFTTESAWRRAALDRQPLETAVVNHTVSGTSVVYDVQGESGDWRNVDRYLFKEDGALIKLRRTFASVSQDIKLTQVFESSASGRVSKTFENEVSLTTGKPKKETPGKPQLPIASNIEQLSFMRTFKSPTP